MHSATPPPARAIAAMKRLTNVQLGRTTGRSGQYIGRVLLGQEKPSESLKSDLADALGVSISEAFGVEVDA